MMTFNDAYGPYLETYGPALVDAFGVTPEIVPTGGNCWAMELRLEAGYVVWITDYGDPLSPWAWRLAARERVSAGSTDPDDMYGFGVSVHRDQPDNLSEAGTTSDTPEDLVTLIGAALRDARTAAR